MCSTDRSGLRQVRSLAQSCTAGKVPHPGRRGEWNMGFRGILGEDCCGLCGNGLMDQVQVVV